RDGGFPPKFYPDFRQNLTGGGNRASQPVFRGKSIAKQRKRGYNKLNYVKKIRRFFHEVHGH
ncbi:hypothetical protein, partial [Dysosmobacter sp.]|uniref:hypothetical protein n=1 Tax=Dysosmobacter sp. TaxID=2591382 RepID=UPI00307CFEBE